VQAERHGGAMSGPIVRWLFSRTVRHVGNKQESTSKAYGTHDSVALGQYFFFTCVFVLRLARLSGTLFDSFDGHLPDSLAAATVARLDGERWIVVQLLMCNRWFGHGLGRRRLSLREFGEGVILEHISL
jgi:hypothetical protein